MTGLALSKVRLEAPGTSSPIDLKIGNPAPTDLWKLITIDGLGPVDPGIRIASTGDASGQSRGRTPLAREIVAHFMLNPYHGSGGVLTPADLRKYLYLLLGPGDDAVNQAVKISFFNQGDLSSWATTRGLVKLFEINPFAKDPDVQITIDCFDAHLTGKLVNLQVSHLNRKAPKLVHPGTAPTGFHMELVFTKDTPKNWTLRFSDTNQIIRFNNVFLKNDRLIIDTRPGHRNVSMIRKKKTFSLFPFLVTNSSWPMLHQGTNNFTTSSQNFDWKQVVYTPLYWGI